MCVPKGKILGEFCVLSNDDRVISCASIDKYRIVQIINYTRQVITLPVLNLDILKNWFLPLMYHIFLNKQERSQLCCLDRNRDTFVTPENLV